ncbi:hypothetical protein G5B31_20745 [Rhodobacter sp. SGA-6-6]|uniref:hypothetical protein n=1 Tax=Rhodobacter sp. SGA-6-6 TaxID=2710882 RepID=UPI0013EC65D2|nr:hypothetical protein [Rhodobacter sp. SGA-6-6]NGM47949.1 hypothetical protein [Rhodobacter sp. SGA-6-6]
MPNPAEITLDPARLTALAAIARRSRASLTGLTDAVYDMRERRRDLTRQRDLVLSAGQASGPAAAAEAAERAAALAAQMADLAADVVIREVEQQEASDAYAAARSNLKTAIAHAELVGLQVPAGVKEMMS